MKTHFLAFVALLLLVDHATEVTGEICPHPEDIRACSCSPDVLNNDISVTCASGNLSAIEQDFHKFQEKLIKTLTLKGLKDVRLPSTLFWGLHVKELLITNCDLQGVADFDKKPAFLGLEKSLEKLTITRSIKGENRLTTLNLAHLTILKELIMEGNNIPELGNDWFRKGPISLKEVDIQNCGIRILGDSAFQSLTNLWFLKLTESPFNTFRRSMLPKPATKFTFLILRSCNLHSLPIDAFSEMEALQYIYLESNAIARLPSATWANIWSKLTLLHLTNNPLECDSHMEWTFEMKRPRTLVGKCVAPEARKNESLDELIRKNQHKRAV